MRRHLNFWETSKIISPLVARLLARVSWGRPLSDAEIAKASGLTIDRVFMIQHMTDWSAIGIVEAEMFLRGCGVDFCNLKHMQRVRNYLRRPTWKYLRVSTEWKSKYEPLVRRNLLAEKTKTK